MATKFMLATAVPFSRTPLRSNLNKTVIHQMTSGDKCGAKEKNNMNSRNASFKGKLVLRREKNKAAAQISRDKAKLQQHLLEEQLSELKYEKMKLLLENESLKRQNIELKEVNADLKHQSQHIPKASMDEISTVGSTIKHAWFVNIPLLKGWVYSKVVFILLLSTWETFKTSSQILNSQMVHFKMLLSMNVTKCLLHLVCLPWKSVIHHANYPHNFIILNG